MDNYIKITFINDNEIETNINCTEYEKMQAIFELIQKINRIDWNIMQKILWKAKKEHNKEKTNE